MKGDICLADTAFYSIYDNIKESQEDIYLADTQGLTQYLKV